MSHLSNVAATLNAGEWGLLCEQGDGSNYGNPIWPPALVATTGAGYRIFEFASTMGYDPHRRRVYYFGGAHVAGALNERPNTGFIGYDIATNHWSALELGPESFFPDHDANKHPYNLLHVVASERVLAHSLANSCEYYLCDIDENVITDITADHWRKGPANPAFFFNNGRGWHMSFPERDSVLRYIPYIGLIQEMKHTESNWRNIFTPSPEYLAEGSAAAYSPAHRKLMFGGGSFYHRFWTIDESGTITSVADLPAGPNPYFAKNGHFWADPVSGDFLALMENGTYDGYYFYSFNVTTNVWTRLTSLEANIPPNIGTGGTATYEPYDLYCSVMTPLRDQGVTIFCGPKVWIYKHAENTDAVGLSHSRKAGQAGTVAAYGFDSASNVRTYPAVAYPLRYTGVTGTCVAALGTNYPYDWTVRGAGEANAKAYENGAGCEYPVVDNTIYNAAGGGTGALRIRILSQTHESIGGYFDTPYQGVDFPKVNLCPHNFGRVWYQMMMRSVNVTNSNLMPSLAGGSGIGPKLVIGASRPPYLVGSDYQSSHDIILDLSKYDIFNGYTYTGLGAINHYHRWVDGVLYVQNEALCEYAVYTAPPCAKNSQDGSWQQLTWYFELRPVATDFTITGTTLSKTGMFPLAAVNYVGRWVYVQSDGVWPGTYHTVVSKISNDALELNSVPHEGTQSVVISDYPNSLVEFWVDGRKIIRIEEQPIFWDGSDISSQNPAGFGAFRISHHMTGKDPTVAHLDAAIWTDDLIISTEPIPLGGSANAMPTNPLIAIHEGSEKIIIAEGRGTEGQTLPTDTIHFTMEWTPLASGIVGLAPIAGTNTCKLTFMAAGQTTIQVKGDADPTTGVQEIFGSVEVEAIAAAPPPPMAVKLIIIDGPETPVP